MPILTASWLILSTPAHVCAQIPAASPPPAPDTPEALTAQALHSLEQNNSAEAHRLLAQAIAISPTYPAANNALGRLLLDEHHYPEAMDRFETVLSMNLQDAGARQGELSASTALALQARRQGNPNAALACLRHAHENLPDDPVLLKDLGIQADQMHLLPLAAESLQSALRLKPEDLDTLYAMARVETELDHLPAAEQHFRTYLAARPSDATAYFGLGQVLEKGLRTEEAKAAFQRSVDLQPVQTESYYHLGQIALNADQGQVAAPLFEKTLERDPHHGGALTGLGILAYRAKDYAVARDRLAVAVQTSPGYQRAHYYLGLTLARLGEKADSEIELKIAADLTREQASPPASVSHP